MKPRWSIGGEGGEVEKVEKVGECSESRPLSVTYFTHPPALPLLAEPPLILTMFTNLLHFDLILFINFSRW